MTRRRGRAIAIALAGAALSCATAPEPSAPAALELPAPAGPPRAPDYALIVSVAGLTPAAYRAEGGRAPPMAAVAALAGEGVSADAVETIAPASTYPAHATLVSGRLPAGHGIPADRRLGDRGVRATRYWHASQLRAPTLWQIASQANRRVAALGWPSTVGASIPLLLPDIEPTRRGQTWLQVLEDSTTSELLAMARSLGGGDPRAARAGPRRDGILTAIACQLLGSPTPPHLLLVRLSQSEPAILAFGPHAPEARAALAGADAEIVRLLECLQRRARLGAAAVFVVGDHGAISVHTMLSPNATLAQRGLLIPGDGAEGGVERWSAIARSNGGSAFVYARGDEDAVRARRVLDEESQRTGAFRVVSAEEMLGLGADPDAWFGLEAEPGFVFVDSAEAAPVAPAAIRGVGGYFPQYAEMNAGFVAWGRGIRQGVRIPSMRQTDVAPTVALLLGLSLEGADGRPLVGALRPGRRD